MSRLEWGWVCSCLERGLPPREIVEALIERARQRRGQEDATRYAHYAVAKACRLARIPF